jgi:hypothetical protein
MWQWVALRAATSLAPIKENREPPTIAPMMPPGSLGDRFARDVARAVHWSLRNGELNPELPVDPGTPRLARQPDDVRRNQQSVRPSGEAPFAHTGTLRDQHVSSTWGLGSLSPSSLTPSRSLALLRAFMPHPFCRAAMVSASARAVALNPTAPTPPRISLRALPARSLARQSLCNCQAWNVISASSGARSILTTP